MLSKSQKMSVPQTPRKFSRPWAHVKPSTRSETVRTTFSLCSLKTSCASASERTKRKVAFIRPLQAGQSKAWQAPALAKKTCLRKSKPKTQSLVLYEKPKNLREFRPVSREGGDTSKKHWRMGQVEAVLASKMKPVFVLGESLSF